MLQHLFNITLFLTTFILYVTSSEKECTCGTWKIPSSYKGNKYDYETVLCGHTINKKNKNKNCEEHSFYSAKFNDFNSTLKCYKVGACDKKEKCVEDKVEKNIIPDGETLAETRCMDFRGENWSMKNCKCSDSIKFKIAMKEWLWNPVAIPEVAENKKPSGKSNAAAVATGFHSIQFCGHELNTKNRNFACSYQTVYECKKWNGSTPFHIGEGLDADLVMTCRDKCISDPKTKFGKKCSN